MSRQVSVDQPMVRLGICPICEFDRMIMVNVDADKFDACPKCGFGYGFTSKCGNRKLRNEALWERVLSDQVVFSLTGSTDTREEVLNMVNTVDPSDVTRQRELRGTSTVFTYSDEDVVENAKLLGVVSNRSLEAAAKLGMMSGTKFVLLRDKPHTCSKFVDK